MAGWRATFDKACMIGEGEFARGVFRTRWRLVDHRAGQIRFTAPLVVALLGLLGYALRQHDFELYNWRWSDRALTLLFGVKALGVKTTVLNDLGGGCPRLVNRLHGWRGKLFERNRSQQAVDAAAAEAAMAEMITEAIGEDPEAFSGTALLLGATTSGVRVDRTRMHQVRRMDEARFSQEFPLVLSPLPHLRSESPEAYRARWRAVVDTNIEVPPADPDGPAPFFGDPDRVDDALDRYQTKAGGIRRATQAWRAYAMGRRPAPLRYPEGTHCPGALCRALPRALAARGDPPAQAA